MRWSYRLVGVGLLAVVLVLGLNGCTGQPLSEREKGTLVGGVLGSATGAIIGSTVGSPGAGAAIGGALGGLGGFAVGNGLQNQEIANRRTQKMLEQQQAEIERQRRLIERLEQQMATE
jgi:uncharacterized protein YcfJ